MKKKIKGIVLELRQGDITSQPEYQAVVNAANAQLRPGGGVAGAIHTAAGPELEEECRSLAPIQPGEAVITDAYNLPNEKVIHCLGPVYGRDEPSDQLLADCYRNALQIAEEEGIKSVAFPAISTGAFGYPMEEAAEVSLQAVIQKAEDMTKVEKVCFVLYSQKALELYQSTAEQTLKNLSSNQKGN